ncbi:HtaA domain-containing protein [Streptomyces sp. NPDC014748]|uniref:HtaA domain-containing protein n=1 Tax=Streptomyces sp. NPDC014748 TaxID=3364905 RepID=UPI0036F5F009
MPATTGDRSRRRPLAFAAAVATAAAAIGAASLAAAPTTAAAGGIPLKGYELTWGIKETYRSYVTGPYAKGTFTTADGASQAAGNGAFTFTDGQGAYDSTSHTVHLAFKGTLTAESGAHHFKRVLSDFQYDSATGVLTADLTADGGETRQDVPFAKVAAPTGADMSGLATTLTAEAGAFLGSDTYAGAAGDPLSVVQTKTSSSPSPSTGTSQPPTSQPPASPSASTSASPSASASASASTGGSPSPSASATGGASPSASATATGSAVPAPARGDIADGRLTWGLKESFRAYVVGPIAKGAITTSGGASQAAGNGAFTFTDATGTYDTEAGTLTAAVKGSVNFKGHKGEGKNGGYGLDLTLTHLKAALSGGSGTLTADVTSLGVTTKAVVLADLKAPSGGLTAKDDVITLDKVAATLTEAGAKAFSGFYAKGTALDPVSLSVALADGADLPSGDGTSGTGGTGSAGGSGSAGASGGTGSDAGGAGSTTGGAGATTGGGSVGGSLAATGSDAPVAALGTAAALAVAAGAGVVFAVRRRRGAPDAQA